MCSALARAGVVVGLIKGDEEGRNRGGDGAGFVAKCAVGERLGTAKSVTSRLRVCTCADGCGFRFVAFALGGRVGGPMLVSMLASLVAVRLEGVSLLDPLPRLWLPREEPDEVVVAVEPPEEELAPPSSNSSEL